MATSEIRHDVTVIIDNANDWPVGDSVRQARLEFETHWSWQAVDALRTLHPSR